MKSNVIAAVAGGLILGGAIFLPMGANAVNQEIKQVTASDQKIAAPTAENSMDGQNAESNVSVQTAGVDPVVSPDPTQTPIAVTAPTFSAGDDDEDSNDDDSYGEDSEDGESDD
jgi:septal ring-binding cell division protein DamX